MQLRCLADAHNAHHTLTQPIARGFDKLRARWEEMENWQKTTDEWTSIVEKRTGKLLTSLKNVTQRIETFEQRLTTHGERDQQLEKIINKHGARWDIHEGRLALTEGRVKHHEQHFELTLANQDHRIVACEAWIADYERQVSEYRSRMVDCEQLLTLCADRVAQCETVVSDLSRSRWRWMLSAARARLRRALDWFGGRALPRTVGAAAVKTVPPPKGSATTRPASHPVQGQNLRVDRD
jgi:chromosome segregation ATPase